MEDLAAAKAQFEDAARFTTDQMGEAIHEMDQNTKKNERLGYHFTTITNATIIMSDGSFGLRASKEGQKGGGLFVCKVPPHEMGWDSYGGRAWREGVGKELWGKKWHEVLLGGLHANKLEVVIIVKIRAKVFNDEKSPCHCSAH